MMSGRAGIGWHGCARFAGSVTSGLNGLVEQPDASRIDNAISGYFNIFVNLPDCRARLSGFNVDCGPLALKRGGGVVGELNGGIAGLVGGDLGSERIAIGFPVASGPASSGPDCQQGCAPYPICP